MKNPSQDNQSPGK